MGKKTKNALKQCLLAQVVLSSHALCQKFVRLCTIPKYAVYCNIKPF